MFTPDYCFRDINISTFLSWTCRSMSRGTTFVMVSFVGKYNSCPFHFCTISKNDIDVSNFLPSKRRSRLKNIIVHNEAIRWQISKSTKVVPCIFAQSVKGHGTTFFAMTPFDGKCQNLRSCPMNLFVCYPSLFQRYQRFKLLTFNKIFHGHRVLFLPCCRSMANIKVC